MGFPMGYSELPCLLLHVLCLLGYVRRLVSRAFNSLGLGDLLEPDTPWPDAPESGQAQWRAAVARGPLIDEALPVTRFAELDRQVDSCAVCLHDFEGAAEVRRLRNCCHVFHRSCLDPWIEHGQRTCPLCRSPLFAEEVPANLDNSPWTDGNGDGLDFFADYPTAWVFSDQIFSS